MPAFEGILTSAEIDKLLEVLKAFAPKAFAKKGKLVMLAPAAKADAAGSDDTETEALIQDAIKTLRAGRTTIVVAHRLSTVRDADQILVLHHGQVREKGTHAALRAAGGLYRRLYELQAREAAGA